MSSNKLRVRVGEDGALSFIYDDRLACLLALGPSSTTRASHVEPAAGDGVRTVTGGWIADMSPSGGPVLRQSNGEPFLTRQHALDAERAWLIDNRNL
jgi:hypothetical protein